MRLREGVILGSFMFGFSLKPFGLGSHLDVVYPLFGLGWFRFHFEFG